MASINELTLTISGRHRIRGLFRAGFVFIGMAIKEIFCNRPYKKIDTADLNFQINIDVSIDRIAKELYERQRLQGIRGKGITPN